MTRREENLAATGPALLADVGRALAQLAPETLLAMAVDECGLGLWDDDLAEIAQGQYGPGALKVLAAERGPR